MVMRLVQGVMQCGILVVHIVGWGGKNALLIAGSLLQVCTKDCLCHGPFIHRVINKQALSGWVAKNHSLCPAMLADYSLNGLLPLGYPQGSLPQSTEGHF